MKRLNINNYRKLNEQNENYFKNVLLTVGEQNLSSSKTMPVYENVQEFDAYNTSLLLTKEDKEKLVGEILKEKIAEAERIGGQYLGEFSEREAESKSIKEAEERIRKEKDTNQTNFLKKAEDINCEGDFYMLCKDVYYNHDDYYGIVAITESEKLAKQLAEHLREHYSNVFSEDMGYKFYIRDSKGKNIDLDKDVEKQ